jgi:hypothetical protein
VGASVKLQLESVMLVELATFGGGGEDEWADEAEDGGYTASESRQSRDEQEWQEDEHEETPDDDEDF